MMGPDVMGLWLQRCLGCRLLSKIASPCFTIHESRLYQKRSKSKNRKASIDSHTPVHKPPLPKTEKRCKTGEPRPNATPVRKGRGSGETSRFQVVKITSTLRPVKSTAKWTVGFLPVMWIRSRPLYCCINWTQLNKKVRRARRVELGGRRMNLQHSVKY